MGHIPLKVMRKVGVNEWTKHRFKYGQINVIDGVENSQICIKLLSIEFSPSAQNGDLITEQVRDLLDSLTTEMYGFEGRNIMLYGEGALSWSAMIIQQKSGWTSWTLTRLFVFFIYFWARSKLDFWAVLKSQGWPKLDPWA